MNLVSEAINKYAEQHTSSEPRLLQTLAHETHETMSAPQMLTGRIEGRFLKFLVQMTQAKHILEIGMFTGYSALSLAEGLPDNGKLITCEVDERAEDFAKRFFEQSPHGSKIEILMGQATDTIPKLEIQFDLVFIDADKRNYKNYYELALSKMPSGGIIALDNMLWSGRVLAPEDERSQYLHELNQYITQDARVENVLLTVRDGIHLVRKL